MQTHAPELLSEVLSTFNGTRFVESTLDYVTHLQFKGRIVLSDNSSGSCREWIASCATAYRDLNLEAFQFDERITFLDKLIATLEKTPSRFVILHAHDDFMVPAA